MCKRLQFLEERCPPGRRDTAVDCSFNNSMYSNDSRLAVTARGLPSAAATSVRCTRRDRLYIEAWFPQHSKVLRRTLYTAAHLPSITPAEQERGDRVNENVGMEASHAAFSITSTDCDASFEPQRRDACSPVGVLLLRKASERECFSKRSRRRVPLLFSNEVHSITFPESSNVSLSSVSSADTEGTTKESVCSNTHTSAHCIGDTIGVTCSGVTESISASITGIHVRDTARALRHRGEKISGRDKGRPTTLSLEKDSVVGCEGGSLDMKGGSSRFDTGSHDVKSDFHKRSLQKRRSRPLRNGLVYIEDDEGTRYGIGYCCPRHPLIAARMLTPDSDKEIDVHFFFRRMQTALLQRQALRETFNWVGSPGTNSISVSSRMSDRGGDTNNCSCSASTSIFSSSRLVRESRSSALKSARCSNERDGSEGGKPAEGTPQAAQFSGMTEEFTTAVNAEERAAKSETAVSISALQTDMQEKQSSKDYFRLINSEGDLLPGVVIDIYGKYASIQLLTCGLDFLLPLMMEALQRLLQPRGIVVRLDHHDRLLEHLQQRGQEKKRQAGQQSQQELEPSLLHEQVLPHHEGEKQIAKQWYRDAAQEEGDENELHKDPISLTAKTSASPSVYLHYSMEDVALPSELPRDLRCLSFGHVPDSVVIEENGCLFPVDLLRGEGTGWLYDRRELRHRLAFLSTGKRVLDLFCKSGGSAITAMRLGGACACVGLCSDERALQLGLQASRLNGLQCNIGSNTSSGIETYSTKDSIKVGSLTLVLADVFDWLAAATEETCPELFDVVVLDPPNWAWCSSDLQQQRQKLQKLIARAARLISERGILVVTCSSRHYCAAGAHFFADVQTASASVGKTATLCGEGGSGPDFPVDVSLPRSTEFLWALIQLESR